MANHYSENLPSTGTRQSVSVSQARDRPLTRAEKWQKCKRVGQRVVELACEGGTDQFNSRLADLHKLVRVWEADGSATVQTELGPQLNRQTDPGSQPDKETEPLHDSSGDSAPSTATADAVPGSQPDRQTEPGPIAGKLKIPPAIPSRGRPRLSVKKTAIGLPKQSRKLCIPFTRKTLPQRQLNNLRTLTLTVRPHSGVPRGGGVTECMSTAAGSKSTKSATDC